MSAGWRSARMNVDLPSPYRPFRAQRLGGKRIFVNSLESHGKVSVIELLKPCPRVEQLRNMGSGKRP
jgi:hypothetical protein